MPVTVEIDGDYVLLQEVSELSATEHASAYRQVERIETFFQRADPERLQAAVASLIELCLVDDSVASFDMDDMDESDYAEILNAILDDYELGP